MFKRKLLTVLVATAAVGFGGFAMNASAATATGTGTALIYTPLSIAQATPMDFGAIAPAAGGGTLTLNTGGNILIVPAGFVLSGTRTAGEFTVTGEAGLTYAISFSSPSYTLTHTALPVNTMTVNNFTLTGGLTSRTINGGPPGAVPVSANDTFFVGANLIVGGGQLAGRYNGTYTVQVDYQ